MGTIRSRQRVAAYWLAIAMVMLALGSADHRPAVAQTLPQPFGVGATGLPLPRFVSLKSDRVQVRQGPGTDHKILWVFNRVGLPVEVIQEFENWRQVRDQDGSVGWVAHSLLSARRTAVILAWAAGQTKSGAAKPVPLRDEDFVGTYPRLVGTRRDLRCPPVRRHMVPDLHRRLSRLCRAGEIMGCLPRRAHQIGDAHAEVALSRPGLERHLGDGKQILLGRTAGRLDGHSLN